MALSGLQGLLTRPSKARDVPDQRNYGDRNCCCAPDCPYRITRHAHFESPLAGQKRPVDVIGNAVHVMRVQTGKDSPQRRSAKRAARRGQRP